MVARSVTAPVAGFHNSGVMTAGASLNGTG